MLLRFTAVTPASPFHLSVGSFNAGAGCWTIRPTPIHPWCGHCPATFHPQWACMHAPSPPSAQHPLSPGAFRRHTSPTANASRCAIFPSSRRQFRRPSRAGAPCAGPCVPGTASPHPSQYDGLHRHPSMALWAFQRVPSPHPLQQVCPLHGALRRWLHAVAGSCPSLRGRWHHLLPIIRRRRQGPKVFAAGYSWRGNQLHSRISSCCGVSTNTVFPRRSGFFSRYVSNPPGLILSRPKVSGPRSRYRQMRSSRSRSVPSMTALPYTLSPFMFTACPPVGRSRSASSTAASAGPAFSGCAVTRPTAHTAPAHPAIPVHCCPPGL